MRTKKKSKLRNAEYYDIQQEFDLMVGALKDTGINASQIITQNIVINNLYSEVA